MGASIGPFKRGTKTEHIYINHLSKVDLITSREPRTSSYLKELGIYKNVQNCADPAFIVPLTENCHFKKSDQIIIGINLSPLSSFILFGKNFKDVIKYQIKNYCKTS